MPSPTVNTHFAMPDPNAAPLNLIQLFQLANVLVSSEIQGEYTPYIKQNGTPGVDDQDKVWFELDTQGRPVAIKVYWHGTWRRVYNGMLNEIRGYSGNPGTDFDSTGWGKVGGEYDGWHLCNGNDGAPDLSDQFLIGAHMNNEGHSGYVDNEWVSWVGKKTGMHVGGDIDFTLETKNIPVPPSPAVSLYGWTVDGAHGPDNPGDMWGKKNDAALKTDIIPASDGNAEPDPVSIIPPFVALAWIIFLGYRT